MTSVEDKTQRLHHVKQVNLQGNIKREIDKSKKKMDKEQMILQMYMKSTVDNKKCLHYKEQI
jgi:hypothetical protein